MINQTIKSNAFRLSQKMKARPAAVLRGLEESAKSMATAFQRETHRILVDKIYSVPIPLKPTIERKTSPSAKIRERISKGKKGLWQRTRQLIRNEKAIARGTDVVLQNDTPYAIHRNNLGTAGHQNIRTPGVKSVQWQSEAVLNLKERLKTSRSRAIARALRNP